ncbi:putative spermidine synthase 1 [Hibiscus syriacus]|uniref:Spermidine synthase 1 n=1 Tax=Hibiscus syriacus TaxID=106335 RepID=A0A6A3BL61_HIBSY|nr:putative spermidine synthase 1 [Hibiscus syriacus]
MVHNSGIQKWNGCSCKPYTFFHRAPSIHSSIRNHVSDQSTHPQKYRSCHQDCLVRGNVQPRPVHISKPCLRSFMVCLVNSTAVRLLEFRMHEEMNATHSPSCNYYFLDCSTVGKPARNAWLKKTNVIINCDALNDDNKDFEFEMFADAFTNNVASSVDAGDPRQMMLSCEFSLVNHLLECLQDNHYSVRRHWRSRISSFIAFELSSIYYSKTRGVENPPKGYRRVDETPAIAAGFARPCPPVPFFNQMDDQILDAICERLVSSLNTKDMYLVREGDPVREMIFIIRGEVESSTTNSGRTEFYSSITLGPGDFCGEELLTWALIPNSDSCLYLPLSTRTVKSITEVEAFALRAWELKYVAKQFKRLHSKKLQHAFRYYSHQWRTWGACFIEAAWRQYKRRKMAIELAKQENLFDDGGEGVLGEEDEGGSSDTSYQTQHLGVTLLASKFAKNTRRGAKKVMARISHDESMLKMPKMFKPVEPDFSAL